MPGLSTYLENALLEYLDDTLVTTMYVSLHTGAVGTTGANEVAGGSYIRVAVTWGAASAGAMASTGAVTINVPASTTVTSFGFWDASTSGNWLGGTTLTASQVYAGAGTLTFAIGQLIFSLTS